MKTLFQTLTKVGFAIINYFAIFILSVFSEVVPPEKFFTIQCGDFIESERAFMRKTELEKLGYDPIFIRQEDSLNKVFFGKFEYYLDAFAYEKYIKDNFDSSVIIVGLPNSNGLISFSSPVSPFAKVFSTPETKINQATDYSLDFNDDLTSPLLLLLNKGDEDEFVPKEVTTAKPIIEHISNVLPDTDPRKGWAMTRLGIIELQAGNYKSARNYFIPVVNGEIKARRLDRIKAMRRVAWTYHIEGDRLTAYRAYRELEQWTASDLMRTIAQVECAGILMEMARSEKGSLEDCRRECQKVLTMAPERFIKQCATAELMYFESYYFENDYDKCIILGEKFLQKYRSYPECKREISAALCFTAQSYARNIKYEETIRLLLELVNMKLTPQDEFYHVDLHKWAINWLVWTYKAMGDKENADYWDQRMSQNWKIEK